MKTTQPFVTLLGIHSACATYQQCARADQDVLSDQAPLCVSELTKSKDASAHSFKHPTWSSRPYCATSKFGQKYCVQTAPNVRHGRGLSIISTPIAADAIASNFPNTGKAQIVSEDDLTARSIPGKGLGLVTLRSWKRGQTILLDSPRVIASAQFTTHIPRNQGSAMFDHAVNHLPLHDRDMVLNLDKSLGGTNVEDIMKTNSFACQLDDGQQDDAYMCLFPSVARINHACRPNAHSRFIPKTLLMEVKALRDIEAGEEISISYGRIDLPHADRQKLYKEGWNFTCSCQLCTSSSYEVAGSDQRRARFLKLRNQLENLTPGTFDAQQIVAWEKEVMELSAKEGLDVLLAQDYERLGYVYAGHQMIKDAKFWANKARDSLLEWTIVDGGPQNELRRVEELLSELGG